ncbi:FUSC family protein [Modestobacter sp. SYSU DS0290]
MSGSSSPIRRLAPHLLGPPLPAVTSLWATHRRRALSAAFCVTAPLVLFVLLDRPDLGSAAALGGFTAVYGHALPYRRRAAVSAGVGVALTATVGASSLAGPRPLLLAVVLGILVAAATAATAVWRIGPPGPLMIALAGGSASTLGDSPTAVAEHVAAAAGGAALAWVVVMLPWLWDPAGPERQSLRAADTAVSAVERNGLGTTRPGSVARAVRVAVAAVAGGSRRRPSLRRELEQVEERFFRVLPPSVPPPDDGPPPAAPTTPPPRRTAPAWAPTAARIGLGATTAGAIAALAGLPSAYWAVSTAVAVLLGTDARHTRARALHRVTGTLAGVGLAALLFQLELPVAATVVVVGLLMLAVELLIASQYVLSVACITPLALLLVHLGNPGSSGTELITVRVAETLVGITVALAAGLLLFPHTGSRRLPGAVTASQQRAVAAAGAPPGTSADRALQDALLAQEEVTTAARAELFAAPGADAWRRRARQVGDLGWALLGARARGEQELAGQVAARIRAELGGETPEGRPAG